MRGLLANNAIAGTRVFFVHTPFNMEIQLGERGLRAQIARMAKVIREMGGSI